MATLTIRNLPEKVRDALRVRAARHGRSMEGEAREVLTAAVTQPNEISKGELRKAVEEVRAALAPYKVEGVSIVDELIAERRFEAWQETLESQAWQRKHELAKAKHGDNG